MMLTTIGEALTGSRRGCGPESGPVGQGFGRTVVVVIVAMAGS